MPLGYQSKRTRTRATLRRLYGNPWDSPRKTRSSRSPRNRTRSHRRSSSSTTSSAHAAWRSVSSKK